MTSNLTLDQSGNIMGSSGISGPGIYTISAVQDFKLPLFLNGPITMSFNQSAISLGQSVTLTWSVSNAFSLSAQQCYAHNIATNGGGGTWDGPAGWGSSTAQASMAQRAFSQQRPAYIPTRLLAAAQSLALRRLRFH